MIKGFIKYVFVFALLPIWIFLIVPEIEPKQNFEQTYVQRGTDQIVSSFGGELSKPFVLEEIATQKIISESDGILEIQGSIIGTDLATDSIIFEFSDIYHVDRDTSKHIDENLGYYSFPRNVEKKDYFMTQLLLIQPTNYEYQKTEKIFELDTYKFSCNTVNQDVTAGFPQFAPHELVIDFSCVIWVEPITGNVVKYQLNWFTHFIEDGQKIHLAEIGGVKITDHTIDILTDLTKNQLLTHYFVQFLGPLVVMVLIAFMISFDVKKKSGHEIVKERKIREQLSEQLVLQQNLRKALDESSIVSILDRDGIITHVNENFCKVSKYTEDELIGKHQSILRSVVHPPEFYNELWTVLKSGKVWNGEICNKAKDGILFWNKTTIIPFLDKDGHISEYVAVRSDITEQKRLSKKLISAERLTAIGELSARISHDIRNPLTILNNEFVLLKEKKLLDKKHSKRVEESIRRITHQLDEVLDFVRVTPLDISKFNLIVLLKKSLDTLNIPPDVKISIPENEIFMEGDEQKMEIVFINLIFNSLQAINYVGTIDILITESNTTITIEIIDSGDGIDITPINKIFEPLVSSKQRGTGLGLASVKNIIIQHEGIITVKNKPTTFTIKIPKKWEKN